MGKPLDAGITGLHRLFLVLNVFDPIQYAVHMVARIRLQRIL